MPQALRHTEQTFPIPGAIAEPFPRGDFAECSLFHDIHWTVGSAFVLGCIHASKRAAQAQLRVTQIRSPEVGEMERYEAIGLGQVRFSVFPESTVS
jgi:hypothetical protein